MNHIYKSIFNKALGVFVAVPEFASAQGKSTQSSNDVVGNSVAGGVLKTAITGLTFMIWMALSANQAVAAPGIYINDGRDGNCQAISDHTNQGGMYSLINKQVYVVNGGMAAQPQPGYFNLGVNYHNHLTGRPDQYNPCISQSDAPHDANTQTNRTLFYGDPEFNGLTTNQNSNGNAQSNGARNLTLGGRLDVNRGIIGLGYMGKDNGTDATYSIRMGKGSMLHESNNQKTAISIGVGDDAVPSGAKGSGGIAIGYDSYAAGAIANNGDMASSAVAIGNHARAGKWLTTAVGTFAETTGEGNVAVGYNANAGGYGAWLNTTGVEEHNNNATAVGHDSLALKENTSAYGNTAKAYGANSTALGQGAVAGKDGDANKINATAVGQSASAADKNTTALGQQASAAKEGATAFGQAATAKEKNSTVIGLGATGETEGATAIGQGATAGANPGDVAVGNGSATAAVVGTNDATVNGIKYSGFAGNNPGATVSVGGTIKRTITNVGAGRIDSTSTDAINGSQLYLTQEVIGNIGQSTVNILGGNAQFAPNKADSKGNITITNIGGTGKNTVHDAIKYLNDGFTITTSKSNGEVNGTTNAQVKPGNTVTVDAGKNIQITQTDKKISVATKDDLTVTSVKAGDSTLNNNGLTINGGPSITKTGGVNAGGKQITNVASGGTTVNNAANIGDVQNAAAAAKTEVKAGNNVTVTNTPAADGHAVYTVNADGTKVQHVAGSPVTVTAGPKDANNVTTYNVDLTQAAKDSLAKANTAVQDVKLAAGENNLTLNKAGNVVELGLTKTPTFTKATVGNVVVDGNSNKIDGVEDGNIAPNSKQVVNGGQLHALKAQGFKVNADNNDAKTNALGSTVSIVAGNATDTSTANLATKVEQDGTGTKVTVSMKNAPTFTGKVSAKGLDAGGEKITNVKAGSDNLDAVNFAQLKAVQDAVKVAQSGAWELQGNGTKVTAVGAGDKVNFVNGTGTTARVVNNAGVPAVSYSVNTATLSAGPNGKVAPSKQGDVFATAEQVAGAINAASFTLASANNKAENATTAKISAGGKVTVDAGKNLTTTQSGSVITVATKDDVTFTSVKAGDSTLNNNGLTINGGPSITKTGGVNAGGKQITNVASGGTVDSNAANIGDVKKAAAATKTEVKAGKNVTVTNTPAADGHAVYTVNADGTKVEHVAGSPVTVVAGPKDANNVTTYKVDLTKAAKDSLAKANTAVQDVKLAAGENNLTLNKAGNVVELGLTKTPTFQKATVGNVVVDGNSNKIDGVEDGNIAPNSKQVVNGGQLHTLKAQGFKVNADNNAAKTNALGSTVSIVAGNATDTSTANLATKVEQDGTGTKVTVSMKNAPTFTGKVSAKGLDAGGEKITNVKAGSDNLDAVNFAQLKAVQDAVKVAQSGAWELQGNGTKVTAVGAGDKVNFVNGTGTTARVVNNAGVPAVSYSVNTATLSAGPNGKVAPSKQGDVFATAEQVAGAINAASFTLASANNKAENATTAKISAGGKVTVDAGKNLTTTQSGSVITVATKDDVTFTSVKAGDSTLNNNGLTINGGPSITKTGGVNAGGKQITNVASGGTVDSNAANIGDVKKAAAAAKTEVKAGKNVTVASTSAADGHAVYTVNADGTKVEHVAGSPVTVTAGPKDANNVTTYKVDLTKAAKDSLAKVATNSGNITALQNQTFKLQANNDVATPVKASDTVKFVNGDNINITRNGNNITVSTAKEVTFDKVTAGKGASKVVLGDNGVEVGGNSYISKDGLNANNKVISNVAPGAVNANSKEAVNGSQLHATNVAVQNLRAGVDAAKVEVKAGNNVAVDVSKGSKGQNIYTVHAEKTTVSGSSMVNVTAGPRSATGVTNYAVDLSQQAKADIADGVAAKNAVNTKGLTFTADSGTTGVKKLGDSVAVNGDNKNITTKATPNGVDVSLNKSISVENVSTDAVNIKGNGPHINKAGAQMANTPITGMASGLPIDPVTGKPMTTVQIEQGIIDGKIDPSVLQNAVNVGDLATQAQNAAQVNNIIYGTDPNGNPYVNANGTMTSAGRAALRTYNVDGKGTYERNGIFSAIKNMNEQGIKFFHTNDGVVQSIKDGTSEEDSNAEAAYSTAIGYQALVEKTAVGGLAIGAGARAVSAGSVALGAQSEAANVHIAAGTHDNAYTYGGLNDNHVAGKPTSATSVLSVGKPGAERQVQNVAAGVISETSTDAVNGSQLYQTNKAVENNTKAINQLRGDVHKMDNKLRAGVAGAYAAASLGQVYIPGKTQVSLGSGHYRGESAVALGVSRISDNGKVQVRLLGSTNTRGDTGAGASVSYLW